ncbi:hypothetical protein [Paraburkholderia humisilvae]|uniref:hypothetical protein n=1 Tax=Paraburkholderia humisilvae TaxID=627669 RepID=UPI0035F0AC9E
MDAPPAYDEAKSSSFVRMAANTFHPVHAMEVRNLKKALLAGSISPEEAASKITKLSDELTGMIMDIPGVPDMVDYLNKEVGDLAAKYSSTIGVTALHHVNKNISDVDRIIKLFKG